MTRTLTSHRWVGVPAPALNSVMSMADAQPQKLSDDLTILAARDAARSADWTRLRVPSATSR